MIMNEKELLNQFLNAFPDSTHPLDKQRFILYALECIKNRHSIDIEAMERKGISPDMISEYQNGYEWLRDAFRILSGDKL